MARVVAGARALDLDHIGSQVGQHLRAPGAGKHAGQVKHLDAGQGACGWQSCGHVWLLPNK